MHIFQKLKASLRLREAVRKADEAHQQTGERYYVMPASADGCKLIIMDRFNFRKLKQKGYITRKAYVADIERECFYFTPYRNGSCAISSEIECIKRRQYFDWYNAASRNPKEMKYTAKGKQNLEGIRTLTNDPLATYQVAGGGKKKTTNKKHTKKRN